jgi:hypothetical protein
VDPLASKYPFYTPYQFAANSPILAIDIDGLEPDKNVNKVEAANELVDNFEKDESVVNGKNSNVDKKSFVKDLRKLINDKNGYNINQGKNSYLCNTVCPLNDFESLSPDKFAKFAIDLYTNGVGVLNNVTVTANDNQFNYVNSEKANSVNAPKKLNDVINVVHQITSIAWRFNGANFKGGDEKGTPIGEVLGLRRKGGSTFKDAVKSFKLLFGDDRIVSKGKGINFGSATTLLELRDIADDVNSGKVRLTIFKAGLNKNKNSEVYGSHFINIHKITIEGKNISVEASSYGDDDTKYDNLKIGQIKGIIILR